MFNMKVYFSLKTIFFITLVTFGLNIPAFAADRDWPMWSGPTANWLASPGEKRLIADLNQAKLLWKSEDKGKMYARSNDGHIYCYDVTAPQGDVKK